MTLLERLRELARNLYWTWHPELVDIFRSLDPELWRDVDHNPVEFLSRLNDDTVAEKAAEMALDARISQAFHQMQAYLAAKDTWGSRHAGPLHARPVAYFSAEFGLHESIPIYSGGLGVLSGDHLKSASDLGVPLVGIGLFYAEGYFRQRLDDSGWQQEEYSVTDVDKLPLERARDDDGNLLQVRVQTRDTEICAGIWFTHVGRNQLVLLDTNVEANSEEDRRLTSHLYGGGPTRRIRQELVLGVGGMRALDALNICPGVLHLNEGHSAFATLEIARQIMEREQRPFEDVREKVAARTVFTTHTPVEAGHDRFDAELIEATLGPLRDKLALSQQDLMGLGRLNRDDEGETLCMTVLGLKMSQYRNAVSERHGRVSRVMWQGVWPHLPVELAPIGHITNGVHVPSWMAASMASLYDRHLGPGWQERMDEPATWDPIEHIDDAEFWEQHQILSGRLVKYVQRTVARQAERRGNQNKPRRLDPLGMTIGFARRFAPYKRGALLFSDRDRLAAIVGNPDRPVHIIFAGKAHPNDEQGKRLIQEIVDMMREEPFAGRIVFIEDHDMNVGRHLVQGADVWLNTPRRPFEACGTSGQKVVLNGGLNLSVLDGWWAQAYDGRNGFAIGCGEECTDNDQQDQRDADALYDLLENQVIPLFYDRNDKGLPCGWIARQKRAIRTLAWRFSGRRMVADYTQRCYLPAVGGLTSSPT